MMNYDLDETIIIYDDTDWSEGVIKVIEDLELLIPPGHSLILVDNEELGIKNIGDRCVIPFLERDGKYWGAPPDSITAIRELERLRQSGTGFIAFAWPGFWWLERYTEFNFYLCSKFPCIVHKNQFNNTALIVFDLRCCNSLMYADTQHRSRLKKLVVHRRLVPVQELTARYREAAITLTVGQGPESLGDYLEFGVNIGSSMACMFKVITELGYNHVRFFGFDSFEGLPEEADTEDCPWKAKAYKCDIKITRNFLTESGVDWSRVYLTKGWFTNTLNSTVVNRRGINKASIIMIDCDLYSSSLQALRFCRPLIKEEAIIFFDDWHSDGLAEKNLGEKKAFDQFLFEEDIFDVTNFDSYTANAKVFYVKRRKQNC